MRVRDGHAVTLTAPSRNPVGSLALLNAVEAAHPPGDRSLITENRSRHTSPPIQAWLEAHPRVHQVFLPTGACWLNRQEGCWRLYRREALAGQDFADAQEIDQATQVATAHLTVRASPWVWGRPPRPHRQLRRRFVYHC